MHVAHFKRHTSLGVCVTGYDPSLPANDVKTILTNHFACCGGEITDVFVLKKRTFIYFFQGDTNKAVKLSGSKVCGGELVVKFLPKPTKPSPPGLPFGYTIPRECVEAAHKIYMANKMKEQSRGDISQERPT